MGKYEPDFYSDQTFPLKNETPPARSIMDRVDVREMPRRVPVIPCVRVG